jgi:O-6-methylguanine DNA methyltransferase
MLDVYFQNFDDIWFAVALSEKQIIASSFNSDYQKVQNKLLCNLPFNISFQILHETSSEAKTILSAIKNIYDGKDIAAQLSLSMLKLPAYTQKVLRTTLAIPVGYVTSYQAIVRVVGGGARAVGNTMAANPFPPIVPCHRVVRSDLSLGGYGAGGLRVKLSFLTKEKRGFIKSKEINVEGGLLKVFPVEHVLHKFAL